MLQRRNFEAASNAPVVYAELPGAEHAFETIHSLRTEETIEAVQRFLEWARVRAAAAAAKSSDTAANATETELDDAEATA